MLLMEHWGYIKTESFDLKRVTKMSCIKEFDKRFIQRVHKVLIKICWKI